MAMRAKRTAPGKSLTYRDSRILGSALDHYNNEVVLVIGTDTWTRQEMVEKLRVGSSNAAKRLTKALKKFHVLDTYEAAATVTAADLFNVKGVGERTVFVFMCALEHHRQDPLTWLAVDREPFTLGTFKRRAKKGRA